MPETRETPPNQEGDGSPAQKPVSRAARRFAPLIFASVLAGLSIGLWLWYLAARTRAQTAAALSKLGGIELRYSPAFFDDPNMPPVVPKLPDDVGYFLWRGVDAVTWTPFDASAESEVDAFWQAMRHLSGVQQIKAPARPGCLAKNVGSASTLESLELDGNVGPSDLDALSQCKELRTLHFGVEGGSPADMKRMAALNKLESFQCRSDVGDDACTLFQGMPNLRSVVFLGTPPSGKAFANAIVNLDSLRRLRMAGCQDADAVCRALNDCELEFLDLSDSDVTDEGIACLHVETDDDSTFILTNTGITPAALEHLCREGEVQVHAESCSQITDEDVERIEAQFPSARVIRSKR